MRRLRIYYVNKILFGFMLLLLLLSCQSSKDKKAEVTEVDEPHWTDLLMEVYFVPADSLEFMGEVARVRCEYSFKDMVTDYGQLDWDNMEDDPFITRHLLCEEDMLQDSLMYRLVDDLICSRDYYEGYLQTAYDWLWHKVMKDEIHTYLKIIYPDRDQFGKTDYEDVIMKMTEYVQPLCDNGGNIHLAQCSQVWHYAMTWLLIDKYKEAVRYANSSILANSYLDDYDLWQKAYDSLVDDYRQDSNYRLWTVECHDLGTTMMTFRAEMLDEEIGYLTGERSMEGVTPEERRKYRRDIKELDLWYDMRKMVGEDVELPWYSHITYKICNDYWEKEISEWPKL